jgi:hypothetical protein
MSLKFELRVFTLVMKLENKLNVYTILETQNINFKSFKLLNLESIKKFSSFPKLKLNSRKSFQNLKTNEVFARVLIYK